MHFYLPPVKYNYLAVATVRERVLPDFLVSDSKHIDIL